VESTTDQHGKAVGARNKPHRKRPRGALCCKSGALRYARGLFVVLVFLFTCPTDKKDLAHV
jgi:hypothetical protein